MSMHAKKISHRQSATERSSPLHPIPATAKLFEQRPNLKTVADEKTSRLDGLSEEGEIHLSPQECASLPDGLKVPHLHPVKALLAPVKPSILQTT